MKRLRNKIKEQEDVAQEEEEEEEDENVSFFMTFQSALPFFLKS